MPINAKCSPSSNAINSPFGPPLPGLPGFSWDINFPTPAFPGLDGMPEDLFSWLDKLKLKLPGGGSLQSYIDSLSATVAKILSNLLNYLNVFMGFYYFILAIVEMLLCIIKVLCAFPKPWSVIRAVKRLIRKCLPIFIQIVFPYFALLILLLSLIAILIALIEYIIAMIKRLIQQLLKNLKKLRDLTIHQKNPNAALAIASKIANLLCLFEQIFGFLGAIFAILDLITSKWDTVLKACNSGGGGEPRDNDDDSVCAPFMKNLIEQDSTEPNLEIWKSRIDSSITSSHNVSSFNGVLTYCNQVFGTMSLGIAPPSPITSTIRNEVIYLQDDSLIDELKFANIIRSNEGFMFFPFDKIITKDTEKRMKPYFLDMIITCDPNPGDGYGNRKINITDVTVTYVSTSVIATVVGSAPIMATNNNGYLILSGGKTQDINFKDKTIEELLSKKGSTNEIKPSYGNGIQVDIINIEYSLKINFDALLEYMLITLSCLPSAALELDFLNATFNKAFNSPLSKLIQVPDIAKTMDDLSKCMDNYKKEISIETTETFGNCMLDIINKLNDDAANTYCQLLQAAIDTHNIEKKLSTDLQFVNQDIDIIITPKDQTGRLLTDMTGSFTPPQSCLDNLSDKFSGIATLGTVSKFAYDGYGNFISKLNSSIGGEGELSLYFEGDLITTTVRPNDIKLPPYIDFSNLQYTFVDSMINTGNDSGAGIRRDETDATT